jgi:hypothetical protein
VHAFSYEHMEEAAYELLGRVAHRAHDPVTVETARLIEGQEHAMGDRLQGCFDRAVGAALRELDPDDISGQLDKYLADAHAIEGQAEPRRSDPRRGARPRGQVRSLFDQALAAALHALDLAPR